MSNKGPQDEVSPRTYLEETILEETATEFAALYAAFMAMARERNIKYGKLYAIDGLGMSALTPEQLLEHDTLEAQITTKVDELNAGANEQAAKYITESMSDVKSSEGPLQKFKKLFA